MENWLVPCAVFTMLGFVVWVIFSTWRRIKIARFQSEVARTMLGRFDSAQSMIEYVETDGGKKFLNSIAAEAGTSYGGILDCMRWGVVFLIIGGTMSWMHAAGIVDHDAQVAGILAVALGVGLEAAAALSYFASKALGLVGQGPKA